MTDILEFCKTARSRSTEHREAMQRLYGLPGMMVSVLRQELDSMVRVIYLLAASDVDERNRLIRQTINGEKWTTKTKKGKCRKVADKDMVNLANKLQGWTKSVYKFGCAFIHLSNFHNYSNTNPFEILSQEEQLDILNHLRYYHGGPISNQPSFDELAAYFPRVFDKIAANLECYLENLEHNEPLEIDDL